MQSRALGSALFGTWFDATDLLALAVDRASRAIVCANPAALALLGAPESMVVGRSSAAYLGDALSVVLSVERPTQVEVAILGPAGPVRVLLEVAPLRHDGGLLSTVVGRAAPAAREQGRATTARLAALAESHERSPIVAELSAARSQLEERNHEIAVLAGEVSRFGWRAAVGEMVAGIAHHLNNPVGALDSTLRRLDQRVASVDDPALRAALQPLVRRACEISSRIESNVSAVVRTHAAATSDTSRRSLVLQHELEIALSLFADRLQQVVVIRRYHELPPVLAPHDSLHLVLSNLIDNAVRAIAGNGVLSFIVRRRHERAVLRISDDGVGIPAALAPHLFEPIVSARRGGVGLGLSTAQRLVKAWGGTISHLPSARGATFELSIPLEPAHEAARALDAAPGPPERHFPAPAVASGGPSRGAEPASAERPPRSSSSQSEPQENTP